MNLINKILKESEEENLFKPRRLDRPDIRNEQEKFLQKTLDKLNPYLDKISKEKNVIFETPMFGETFSNQADLLIIFHKTNESYHKFLKLTLRKNFFEISENSHSRIVYNKTIKSFEDNEVNKIIKLILPYLELS